MKISNSKANLILFQKVIVTFLIFTISCKEGDVLEDLSTDTVSDSDSETDTGSDTDIDTDTDTDTDSDSEEPDDCDCSDLDAVTPPLSIRYLRQGDKMRPFGMDGHKKISDILSDKKVPLRRRGQTVVISDQKEILWLVGVTTTESTRISRASQKILKLTVVAE